MRLARWLAVTIVAAALWSIGAPANAAPPTNDKPSGASRVASLPFTHQQSTAGATADPQTFNGCGVNEASVWFKFTARDYGTAVAQTRGSSYDTVLAVFYADNGKPAYSLGCSDDAARQRSVLTFYTSPGSTYFVQVSGFLGATGTLRLAVNRGGRLSGIARDGTTGRPVPDTCISFAGPATPYDYVYAYTSPTGFYELTGLPSGEYRPTNDQYACAQRKVRAWPRPALVAEGFATRGQDIVLDSGVVEGNVFDEWTHFPVKDVCVAGVNAAGSYVAFGSTSSTGYYSMVAPPGQLRVSFQDCSGQPRYAPEFYDGATSLTRATPVHVAAGVTASPIDASLLRASSLKGNVVDARTGDRVDACIQVVTAASNEFVGFGYTFGSPSGYYRIDGLPPEDVLVRADECTYPHTHAPVWYPHASLRGGAQSIALYPGFGRRADFKLDGGGTIAGVLRRDGGGALADECVIALAPDGAQSYGFSSPTGLYVISALPPTRYNLRVGGCASDVAPEWYRDAGDKAGALGLAVTLGGRLTANASLAREGRFRATVVDPSSPKRPEVCVAAAPSDLETYYDVQFPTQTGLVGFGNLGATKYDLKAINCGNQLDGGPEQELGSFQGVPGQVKNLGNLIVKLRDADGDGVPDRVDNCPLTPNANQADVNNDDLGNACDRLHRG